MDPRRIVPLLAAMACLAAAGCAPRVPRPNVLLVVVDTLRADRLSCYGHGEATSPNVDRLAAQGVLFERISSHAPQTLPSFCSLLTGTYPVTHGVRSNGYFALADEAETLAEQFQRAGYRTAAFIGGFPLDARFGLAQGFDDYHDEMLSTRPMKGLKDVAGGKGWLGHVTANFESLADQVTEQALAWLDANGESPFFALVHYFDPHHDYAPPERFRERFPDGYSGEVAFVDEQFGRLLARLDDLGVAGRTLVAFTADHGECLGEQKRFFHQEHLVEAVLHVPLVLRMPGRLPEGSRVGGRGRAVDVMPTLLELAGLAAPAPVQGESLVSALRESALAARPTYFETLYGLTEAPEGRGRHAGQARAGITLDDWKLVRSQTPGAAGAPPATTFELFDLARDPAETRNLAAKRPRQLDDLKAALERFESAHERRAAVPLDPDSETLARLKALGYF